MSRIQKAKSIFIITLIGLTILALALSCEHHGPVEFGQLEPTIRSIQSNIFNLNCALSSCHIGPNPASGLNLSEGNAFGNIVGVPSQEVPSLQRVKPNSPDSSYLVWKIEGRQGIQGERMPRTGTYLSQEQIDVIRQWIANGALPETNAPVVSDIPDQTIEIGQSFNSFDLDDFVTDADHPDSLIDWQISRSATADSVFSISVDAANVVTIDVIDTTFIGSETFTFMATDPDGLSDSDTARFTVRLPIVTFSQIQQNIFNQKCAVPGCHIGPSNQLPGSMDLREGNAYGNIVNMPSEEIPSLLRVNPGQPDSSYIVWKVEGRPGIQGQRMPRGGPPLSQDEINAIRNWIQAGAPFNKKILDFPPDSKSSGGSKIVEK